MVEDLVWISGDWTPWHADSIISLSLTASRPNVHCHVSLVAYCILKKGEKKDISHRLKE